VLIAEVRFQTVEESILRDLDLEEGEDVYVVDSSGLVIAHRNPTYVLRQTTFDLPDTEGRHEGLSGSDVILAMDNIQLENQNLTVVAETDYSKALGLATDLTQLSVIITALGLLISAIIVTLAVGRMINPIVKMARVAQDIQGGNLNARAQETGGSEIATLGRSFNGMTEQLSNSLKGLQQNVEQLEKAKVEREALIKDLQTAKRLVYDVARTAYPNERHRRLHQHYAQAHGGCRIQ
jgi:methyl-accepting chemotaxis protein